MTTETLLTREAFKAAVFARDGGLCVFCKEPAQDAHHILDRKLFVDGGYYISNGASVCHPCHMKCETTEYSVEMVREKCGIVNPSIPRGMSPYLSHDKWGNILYADGRRFKGPLFMDDAVQKLLKRELWRYEDPE